MRPDLGTVIICDEHVIQLTGDPKEVQELRYLKFVCENEMGHGQWGKQTINITMMVSLIMLNLINGSKNTESIVGVPLCSWIYFSLQVVFVLWCIFGIWVAVKSNAGV